MHARDLVELASLAAAYGRILMQGHPPLPEESVQQYWIDSKVRLDRWSSLLHRYSVGPGAVVLSPAAEVAPPSWSAMRVLIEEVFLSDVLARVWTAIGVGIDCVQGTANVGPVVRNVLQWQIESCNRAMQILLDAPHSQSADAALLNQTRMVASRWTDVLIGVVSVEHDLTSLACDPRVAADMAGELRTRALRGHHDSDHAALIGPLLATTRTSQRPESQQRRQRAHRGECRVVFPTSTV